jgi:hypothetical protein
MAAAESAVEEPPAAESDELVALGQEFVAFLERGEYAAAVKRFDAVMTRVMSPEQLEEAWKSVLGSAGPLQAQIAARMERAGKFDVVLVTCRFEKGTLDVKVVFDKARRVTGLWFAPAEPPAEYKPPDYVRQDAFEEKPLSIGTDPWVLPATLSMPEGPGPFPAVVLVHGSGPNDRDETIGPNKPFRDLAWGLASRSVAVLRYEKRTRQYGARLAAAKEKITVSEETIEDVLAAVSTLRDVERIDAERIFVLGHSLGGMLVPRIARQDSRVAGFIIMAGNTRPLEDLIVQQTSYILSLDGKISAEEQAQIDTIEAQVAKVKDSGLSAATPAAELPFGVHAEYWLDLGDYHPAEAAKELQRPLLILQGERDYQVTMEDFQGWKQSLSGRENVRLKSYPALNHLFAPGEGKSTPAEYATAGHVAKAVVEDLADWIAEQQE